jgi:cytochrome c oxidase assembly protein subunit 11
LSEFSLKSKPLKSHRKKILLFALIAVAMFGYSFALVPLYNVFCNVTGLNGKPDLNTASNSRYRVEPHQIQNRFVTIEFDVNKNVDLRCEIKPEHQALRIKPGALTTTSYFVKNLSDKKIIIQAIPSISPGKVAKYLKKLECFCFNQQILKPYESVKLPLRFWLEPEFPDSVYRLTLSYTLFEVKDLKKENNRGT